jgi:hypothetical protein
MQGPYKGCNSNNCKNILSYLISQNTKSVVNVMKYVFDFQLWFFMMNIEMARSEEEDSFEYKSYNTANDDSTNELSGSLTEDSRTVYQKRTYKSIIYFCLAVLNTTFDVWNLDDELTDHVLAFAIIYPLNTATSTEIIKSIIPQLNDFNKIDNDIIASIVSNFPLERRKRIGMSCLTWGLCCGNTRIATRALDFYVFILEPNSHVIINALISAIQICSIVINESTTQRSKDWKTTTLYQDVEPNVHILINYITSALNVLEKLVQKSNDPFPSLFFIVASMLSASGKEYTNLTASILKLISVLLKHKPTINILKSNEQKPQDYDGLLIMFEKMIISDDSISIIYDIICSLLKEGLTNLLLDGVQGCVAAFMLLFQLSNLIDTSVNEIVSDITLFPSDLSDKLIEDLKKGSYQTSVLVEYLGEFEISLIVSTLEHCLISTNKKHLKQLFTFCAEIIVSKPKISSEIFSSIITRASKDNEAENSSAALKLLQIAADNIKIIPSSNTVSITKRPFPVVYFPDEFTPSKKIDNDSKLLFEDPSMFPLLPIYDSTFLMSKTVQNGKNALKDIKTWPFYEWDETFVKAQKYFDASDLKKNIECVNSSSFIESVNEASPITSMSYGTPTRVSHILSNEYSSDLNVSSFVPSY